MYYNVDMFKAAGLDPEKPPKTYEELVAAAQKLTIQKRTMGIRVGDRVDGGYFAFKLLLAEWR